MTLALHGHHVLLIATLAFVAAVLTPNWYTRTFTDDTTIDLNVFQICKTSTQPRTCEWILSPQAKNVASDKSR
jgi:hypothetical protein